MLHFALQLWRGAWENLPEPLSLLGEQRRALSCTMSSSQRNQAGEGLMLRDANESKEKEASENKRNLRPSLPWGGSMNEMIGFLKTILSPASWIPTLSHCPGYQDIPPKFMPVRMLEWTPRAQKLFSQGKARLTLCSRQLFLRSEASHARGGPESLSAGQGNGS